MKLNLFDSDVYFVDKKSHTEDETWSWGILNDERKIYAFYQIYNDKCEKIGSVKQISETRGFWSPWYGGPTSVVKMLEIRNSDGKIEASISNSHFSIGLYKYTIKDAQGKIIGMIKQGRSLSHYKWKIFNTSKVLDYEIIGKFDWTFTINNSSNNQIGSMFLNLKWSGTGKMNRGDTPTTYKYKINFKERDLDHINKLLFLSGMIALDMASPAFVDHKRHLNFNKKLRDRMKREEAE